MQLFCFGDSLTYGAWDSQGGWVARVRSTLDASSATVKPYPHLVYTFGVPGNSSAQVLDRFVFEFEHSFNEERGKQTAVIFQCGTNDLRFMKNEAMYTQDSVQFEKNITALMAECDRLGIHHVAIHAIPLIDESKPGANQEWKSRSNADVARYNKVIERAAGRATILKTPHFALDNLGSDGLHPNDSGHALLAETALAWITSLS
jgi:lysophospholipase L1-like esterase